MRITPNPEAATGAVPLKKRVLKNFTNFTGKHLYWSFYLAWLKKTIILFKKNLLKKDSNTDVFLWNLRSL